MRWLTVSLVFTLLSCGAGRGTPALHHPDLRLAALAGSDKGEPDLFSSYRAEDTVRWNQGWPWKLDLSGVAWDLPNTATVITSRHVVMAAHFTRAAGRPIVFHDRSGRPHTRTIQQVVKLQDRGLMCDVAVGLLDEPLPASIRRYPLPAPTDEGGRELVGATLLVTEQKRKLFFHRVADIQGNWLRMRFDDDVPDSRRKTLISGDSGHPSFFLSKGELVLAETHTGGGAGSGPWYGSRELQGKLAEVVRELDGRFSFRTVGFDTPTLDDAAAGRAAVPPPEPPAPQPPPAEPKPAQPSVEPGRPRPRPRVVLPPRS